MPGLHHGEITALWWAFPMYWKPQAENL